jgi:tetratricopeptide (TPR) repeat protein
MNLSDFKRSTLMYAVLILMLIGLATFSVFPIFNAVTAKETTSSFNFESQKELNQKAQGYQLVLDREPQNQTALQGLLEIRLKQGDLAAAVVPLETLANLNPDLIDYSILLAQTKQQLTDYEGAKAVYQSLLSQNPSDIRVLQGMINLLLPLDESQTAIDLIQKTLRQNQLTGDNLIGVQLLLGQVYALSDRLTEAIAVYDQMIAANQQDFRPLVAKAIVVRNQGDTETASNLFIQALSLAPTQYQEQIQALANLRISE